MNFSLNVFFPFPHQLTSKLNFWYNCTKSKETELSVLASKNTTVAVIACGCSI